MRRQYAKFLRRNIDNAMRYSPQLPTQHLHRYRSQTKLAAAASPGLVT